MKGTERSIGWEVLLSIVIGGIPESGIIISTIGYCGAILANQGAELGCKQRGSKRARDEAVVPDGMMQAVPAFAPFPYILI